MTKRRQTSTSTAVKRERIQASRPPDHWLKPIGMVVLGCLAMAFVVQSVLSTRVTATRFFSSDAWYWLGENLGGQFQLNTQGSPEFCDVPILTLFVTLLAVSIIVLAGYAVIAWFKLSRIGAEDTSSVSRQTCRLGASAWRWWFLPWLWELLRILAFAGEFETTMILMTATYHYVVALSLAGWITELVVPMIGVITDPDHGEEGKNKELPVVPITIAIAVVAYVAVFTAMNWQLYRGMLVPHGDSVMYEEHLWNVLHGKGFRSYLDQGLFLGEHIQVIHLALVPLYAIWPSHLLLELCESLALAAGAIPVFWMARRWSGSSCSAVCLSIAWLLYAPMQFLDVAIDLKTFRPISFGVTAMLFALDQLERGRLKSTAGLFVVALAAKEDFALILAPLGFWIIAQPFLNDAQKSANDDGLVPEVLSSLRKAVQYGLGLSAAAFGYLLLTTRVLIPWFRDGAEVHYARYFAKFGDSLGEIIINMLTQPGLLIQELVTVSSVGYLLALLLPLAFLPLFSPFRFAVGAPILALLCLNEIVKGDPQPHHHFHAPVLPVLFWAAAHSLQSFRDVSQSRLHLLIKRFISTRQEYVPVFTLILCGLVGAIVGMSPLSIKFWDTGSFFHWKNLYASTERADRFASVLEQIPMDARVASTDFVHPRFTHHERSYDYSNYLRKVADYEDQVPADTDFIVIDTQHYYSTIKSPDQVRELQIEPEKWELLDDRTDGYFIVLKRR